MPSPVFTLGRQSNERVLSRDGLESHRPTESGALLSFPVHCLEKANTSGPLELLESSSKFIMTVNDQRRIAGLSSDCKWINASDHSNGPLRRLLHGAML